MARGSPRALAATPLEILTGSSKALALSTTMSKIKTSTAKDSHALSLAQELAATATSTWGEVRYRWDGMGCYPDGIKH